MSELFDLRTIQRCPKCNSPFELNIDMDSDEGLFGLDDLTPGEEYDFVLFCNCSQFRWTAKVAMGANDVSWNPSNVNPLLPDKGEGQS